MADQGEDNQKHKVYKGPHSGRKADKKKAKNPHVQDLTAKQRNPKAFAFHSVQKAERTFRRTQDIQSKKHHIPQVDRTPDEPPPFVVAIVGPPKVGKTTLMKCLIKNFCRQNLVSIHGPVTIVAGKKRRFTFMECNNDINSMIDMAKVADLVLLLVDASFGFEMETFEFLNVCQVHGFPKIMGVLTHLDVFKNISTLRKTKKQMKQRFWTEIYQGAKLFYLSGMIHNEYLKNEIHNLGRFLSVMKFQPQLWRVNHPYILVDRMEELTNPDLLRKNPICQRTVCLYGYTRGAPLKNNSKVHIPGCGDYAIKDVSYLSDPCPLPDQEKHRSLNEKERLIYAPMSGVGGIVYDKDAVYIELGGSHSHDKIKSHEENPDKELISVLVQKECALDKKMEASTFTLFSGDQPLTLEEIQRNGEEEPQPLEKRRKVDFQDTEEVDEGFELEALEESESVDDEGKLNWKENLSERASEMFIKRQSEFKNLSNLVYGSGSNTINVIDKEEGKEDLGGMFQKVQNRNDNLGSNEEESSKHLTHLFDWSNEEVLDSIKDCFVTGKWSTSCDAKALLEQDDDMYGDFEDLECDDEDKNKDEVEEEEDNNNHLKGQNLSHKDTRAEKLKEKKKKLKAMFDAEYDETDGKSFYDELKAEQNQQSQLNKSEFEHLEDSKRVLLEGFRAGLYVRVELENVPSELISNFDPNYPLILGGLLSGEDTLGYVQVRIKKHRWYQKILKNRDPLIFSLGWRRFQTIPLYSVEDHNGRQRMLKYTPQHLYCMASFWGPITPQGTGILAVQSLDSPTQDFRICATGVILDLDKSTQLVKKLKLTGTPFKIYKKTAFVKGMFNSALEVSKFEGALVRTVSGLRGQIKKAIRAPPGSYRATFEDKILLSDIVFLRSWYTVSVPQFYTVVTSLLSPLQDKVKWQGMKTVGQLKREKGIQGNVSGDSLYTAIQRKERSFKSLVVPKDLQRQLPFKDKMRYGVVDTPEDVQTKRIAVVQEPHEKRVSNLLTMMETVNAAKRARELRATDIRVGAHKKAKRQENLKKIAREKMIKKRVYQALGKMKKSS